MWSFEGKWEIYGVDDLFEECEGRVCRWKTSGLCCQHVISLGSIEGASEQSTKHEDESQCSYYTIFMPLLRSAQ